MSALTVAAWVVFWNPTSVPAFAAHPGGLDEALVEWTGVDEKGMPFRRPRTAEQEATLRAAAKGKTVLYGMANNYVDPAGFDAARMSLMLNDPTRRKAHVEALATIAGQDKLDGFDLDYESLKADDKDEFTLFVRDLAAALHRNKRKLSVTVHPKQEDDGSWDGPKAQDYAAIGKWADVVRVMAYDFSWSTSKPGPIAPDDWVRRVAKYAISRIPAKKVSLGIPCYGYDWSKTPATSLTYDDYLRGWGGRALNLAPDSGEDSETTMRFAGAAAFARKLAIAKELGLGGVSFWYVGSEDPYVWKLLRSQRK